MLSAVSMGGHWKKIPFQRGTDEFKKNLPYERGVTLVDLARVTGDPQLREEHFTAAEEQLSAIGPA